MRTRAKRYGVRQKTVAKVKKQTSVADLATGPSEPKSSVLSGGDENVAASYNVARCLKTLVKRLSKNHLRRALGLDELRLAALEATLKLYRNPDRLAERLPTFARLTRASEALKTLPARIRPALERAVGPDFEAAAVDAPSEIGSCAMPLATIPIGGLAIASAGGRLSGSALQDLAAAFPALNVPVIGRIAEDWLIVDLYGLDDVAVFDASLDQLASARSGGAS